MNVSMYVCICMYVYMYYVCMYVRTYVCVYACIYVCMYLSIYEKRSIILRCFVGSILHGVDPLSNFSFQPVLHDWCNKGRGMGYPVCGWCI